ncbi:succinate dehydrogenase assembly factor 2, mitochondrial [Nilaparvata lugens]|uniref:succinate dehydrogenase assembly factor 2, mitochondrial n=1 Tax=Nilaparvata lugens TaxID=108931 RepID=UPI00193DB71D|nr:succinate dehydrogenase assembly factor 2, mitochondrial [Nilaparvata lugens]
MQCLRISKQILGLELQQVCLKYSGRMLRTDGILRSEPEEFFPPSREPSIPRYEEKMNESVEVKRARLLYQSRKRGMLENDILLGNFANDYLQKMDKTELSDYDRLINLPSNDWDIYHWATGIKPTPNEFDNSVMHKLKEYVQSAERLKRLRQPDSFISASN